MKTVCATLSANTPATIGFVEAEHELVLSNPLATLVYVKFNWMSGDTEVSATNFDTFIPVGSVLNLVRNSDSPRLSNMRALCATAGNIGVMGW
jgi:hypothetical protein